MLGPRILAAAGVALVAAATVLVFWNPLADRHPADRQSSATENSTRPPKLFLFASDIRKDCTNGQRSEVLIGDERLSLDLRVLRSLDLADGETWPGRCPAVPLRATTLWFYIPDDVSGPIYRERGLRLHYLRIEDPSKTSGYKYWIPQGAPERRATIEGQGTIDHVMEENLRYSPGTQSGYRLEHFKDSDGKTRPAIKMICSGQDSKTQTRTCRTSYLFDGLAVEYVFIQSRRWRIHEYYNIPPEGVIPEPEGLLDFDRRIRDWLIDMKMQNPG